MSLLAVVPLLALFVWLMWSRQRLDAANDLDRTIDKLALLYPAEDLTAEEWDAVLFWTQNLHSESMLHLVAGTHDIRRLQRDIDDCIQSRNIDLSTIVWIWKRYGQLSESGERYRRKYQHIIEDIGEIVERGD